MSEFAHLVVVHGKPTTIVSDNGIELTSGAVLSWVGETKIDWHRIAPGKLQNWYRNPSVAPGASS